MDTTPTMLGALLQQLEPLLTTAAAQRVHALADRLMRTTLNVAVLGHFKRGKSTLVNALVGYPVLPMGMVPLTAIVTYVEAGPAFSATITFQDGHTAVVPIAQLREYITETENPANAKRVAAAVVQVPTARLPHGIRLVDTPGIGSTYAHNTAIARAFVADADVALFVLSVDPPMSAEERAFLEEVARFARRLLIVLNKIDRYSPADVADVITFTRKVVADHVPACPILPVSALLALEGQIAGDAARIEQSGIQAIEQFLVQEVYQAREALLVSAAVNQLHVLISEAEQQRQATLAGLATSREELTRRLDMFRQRVAELDVLREERDALLRVAQARLVDQHLGSALSTLRAELLALANQLPALIMEGSERSLGEQVRAVDHWIVETLRSTTVAWMQREEPALLDVLGTITERYRAALQRALDALQALAQDVLAVPALQVQVPEPVPVTAHARLQVVDEPVMLELLSMWLMSHLPGRIGRWLILRRAQRRLEDYADRMVGSARYALRQWIAEQLEERRAVLESAVSAVLEALTQGVEAAQAAMLDGEDAVAALRVRLQAELAQLEQIRAALEDMVSGGQQATVAEKR
jgi:GTP-binding protein EngB required for normal cell division